MIAETEACPLFPAKSTNTQLTMMHCSCMPPPPCFPDKASGPAIHFLLQKFTARLNVRSSKPPQLPRQIHLRTYSCHPAIASVQDVSRQQTFWPFIITTCRRWSMDIVCCGPPMAQQDPGSPPTMQVGTYVHSKYFSSIELAGNGRIRLSPMLDLCEFLTL